MSHNASEQTKISRNISSTWLLTVAGISFFNLVLVFLWHGAAQSSSGSVAAFGALALGILWAAGGVVMLYRYRWITDTEGRDDSWFCQPWVVVVVFAISAALGIYTWFTVGLLVASFVPVAQMVVMLRWPEGTRARLTGILTLLLVALAFWDYNTQTAVDAADSQASLILLLAYAAVIPPFSVFSLWWWDIVIEIDEARIAEGELSATRERLRLANDLHDLQGHHLQVVALQLELTERLLESGSETALEHLREARRTVTTAQTETRDLAQRMRPVNIQHEVENAAELLRVAGATVVVTIDSALADVPSEVLAPVIRECTTNALRHGGGHSAEIRLVRTESGWEFSMSNDIASNPVSRGPGSGLASVKQRVEEAGGTVRVQATQESHTVSVFVPSMKVLSA